MRLLREQECDALDRDLAESFPTLHLRRDPAPTIVRGTFPLLHGAAWLDRFSLEVRLAELDAVGLPAVYEVGGRIPRVRDRHIEANGKACLYLPEELALTGPAPLTLVQFLRGPVHSFFLGQALMERGDRPPFGECPHGEAGRLEFLSRTFGTKDVASTRRLVTLASREHVRGHHPCFCGSGTKLRACHRPDIDRVRDRFGRPALLGLLDVLEQRPAH